MTVMILILIKCSTAIPYGLSNQQNHSIHATQEDETGKSFIQTWQVINKHCCIQEIKSQSIVCV